MLTLLTRSGRAGKLSGLIGLVYISSLYTGPPTRPKKWGTKLRCQKIITANDNKLLFKGTICKKSGEAVADTWGGGAVVPQYFRRQ